MTKADYLSSSELPYSLKRGERFFLKCCSNRVFRPLADGDALGINAWVRKLALGACSHSDGCWMEYRLHLPGGFEVIVIITAMVRPMIAYQVHKSPDCNRCLSLAIAVLDACFLVLSSTALAVNDDMLWSYLYARS